MVIFMVVLLFLIQASAWTLTWSLTTWMDLQHLLAKAFSSSACSGDRTAA
jgi:hypothetical protein